jgi:hypothetical protein
MCHDGDGFNEAERLAHVRQHALRPRRKAEVGGKAKVHRPGKAEGNSGAKVRT